MGFTYLMSTKVYSDYKNSENVGDIIKGQLSIKKLLIVTDKGIIENNLLDGIIKSLNESDINYAVFDGAEINAKSRTIGQGLKVWQEENCEAVLAVGGGSSIDTAKAIAVMANNPGDILDYEGVGHIKNDPIPIIAVPTTAGTGSEVTNAATVVDEETLYKVSILGENLFPDIAILDPHLTISCPPSLTAATGMDALTHAIESYLSKNAQPISEGLALQAMKLIYQNISRAYFVGTDIDSRKNMLEASMLAGIAFAQSRLGNVHAISHAIGGLFDVPHGIANATLLPFVLKYNMVAVPEKMKDIAKAFELDITGLNSTEVSKRVLQAIVDLNESFNIPNNIKDLGVSLDILDKIVTDSMRSGNVLVNPRLTTAKDIEQIIVDAFHGKL